MEITRLSENTVIILFQQSIKPQHLSLIKFASQLLQRKYGELIIDIVPAYASIFIVFDLLKTSGDNFVMSMTNSLTKIEEELQHYSQNTRPNIIEIPIYYNLEVGVDLEEVATFANLSIEQIIALHSERTYDVYAIGFAPGFCYLGNVDKKIACPRKVTPCKNISAGSLGIADQQTAIYPNDSPGGWQIIGKTPISMLDYGKKNLTLLSVGDKVKFIPISRSIYIDSGGII